MIGLAPIPTAALVQVLAQTNDPGGHGDDFGKSSPLGLLVLVLFLISTAFLVRSMNKHLRRVPATFEPGAAGADDAAEPGAAETPGSAESAGPIGGESPESTGSATSTGSAKSSGSATSSGSAESPKE